MTVGLSIVPNPAPPSTVVAVSGTGFVNRKTRLLLDGAGATTNIFRPRKDGTFHVGITVASSAKTQTLVAQQQTSGIWAEVARTTVVVAAVVEPPPPPPPPVLVYPTPRVLTAIPHNNDPKPAPGQVITDSTYGTQVRRISPDGHQNQYAKHQAWSKDGSLILLQRGNLVDGRTFAFFGGIAQGGEYPLWSNVEPATLYGVLDGYGPRFGRWRRDTGWTTYRDFGAVGYTWIAVGNYEGTLSRDDKCHILARRADGSEWMFVYNIPTNSIGPAIQRRHPDGSSISQSGRYVVLGYPTAGTGPTQGTWLLRDDMTVVRQMVSNTPESGGAWVGGYPLGHNDFGWGVDGSEVLVYVEPGGGGVCAQRLDNGLEYWVDRNTISGVGHVSCTAYDRPGYAALSSNSYYPTAPGVNALFVVRIEPWSASTRYEVYAMLHAENPVTHQQYDYAPHCALNRDGTLGIWGSVWSNTAAGPMSAYIAGMRA